MCFTWIGRTQHTEAPLGGSEGPKSSPFGLFSQPQSVVSLHQLRRNRAITIDRLSRLLFPVSFFILNAVYWSVFIDWSWKFISSSSLQIFRYKKKRKLFDAAALWNFISAACLSHLHWAWNRSQYQRSIWRKCESIRTFGPSCCRPWLEQIFDTGPLYRNFSFLVEFRCASFVRSVPVFWWQVKKFNLKECFKEKKLYSSNEWEHVDLSYPGTLTECWNLSDQEVNKSWLTFISWIKSYPLDIHRTSRGLVCLTPNSTPNF